MLISTIMSLEISHVLLLLIVRVKVLLPTSFCSHLVPGTAMTVINVSFNLIITAYGLEHALAKRTIVVFGEFLMSVFTYMFHSLAHQLRCAVLAHMFYTLPYLLQKHYSYFFHWDVDEHSEELIVSTDVSQSCSFVTEST